MKTIYKILFSLLLITLLVAAIFHFSEQSGSDSHSISNSISMIIAQMWANTFWSEGSQYSVDTLASMLDGPIRKLAHLCIYTALGLGNCIVVHIFVGKKIRFRHILVCIIAVALVASMDEFNQYFQSGRGASFADVCLDTVGGCIGIYLVFIFRDFIRHIKNGIRHGKEIKQSIKNQ